MTPRTWRREGERWLLHIARAAIFLASNRSGANALAEVYRNPLDGQ